MKHHLTKEEIKIIKADGRKIFTVVVGVLIVFLFFLIFFAEI